MKKQYSNFFANLFGAKGRSTEPEKTKQVIVRSDSQPHVLQQKMKEGRLTHGETVTVNITPVRLENAYGKMILYFCPMKTMEILETSIEGDGGEIPGRAIVEGLSVSSQHKAGFYSLKNVKLTSNGTIQVISTQNTTWESVPADTI